MHHSGERVGRYVVEAPLGRGGMGEVYLARDPALGRQVALKLLPYGAEGPAHLRLLREARAAAALEHPNVVTIHDVGEHDGVPYLVLELVRGRPLRSYVGDEAIPLSRRLRWLAEIARALEAAHERGLLHRDVKPDNVMIRDDGVAKVLDFGIATWRDDTVGALAATSDAGAVDLTAEGVLVGTPLYLAPEQLRGEELDPRVDQFAWGVTAYELCAGRVPWRSRDTPSLAKEIEASPVTEVPSVPPEIARIVKRALSTERGDRFGSMREVAAALEPFAEVRGSSPERRVGEARAAGPRRAVAVVSAALAVGAFAAAVHWSRLPQPTSSAPTAPSAAPLAAVGALRCEAAAVEGGAADVELSRAIGVGACARLAVELGVDWSSKAGGERVEVRARLPSQEAPQGPVSVVLRVGAREVTVIGPTPLAAVDDAVERLRSQFEPVPFDKPRIDGWGARDEAEARLVERTWRRIGLRAPSSVDAELRRLLDGGHASPWLALLLADISWPSSPERTQALARVTATSGSVSGPRREAIAGYAEVLATPGSPDSGLARLRRANTAAPEDQDISSLHAIALARYGPREETLGVLERLSRASPERSLRVFRIAIQSANRRGDPGEVDRWSELLASTLPEAIGWPHRVLALVHRRKLDEARIALRLTERLGAEAHQPDYFLGVRAELDLASLDPTSARARGRTLMGSPHDNFSAWGAGVVVAAHWMEGRGVEAQSIASAELSRRRIQNPVAASERAVDDLRHRRWLGQPPPEEAQLAWIESILDSRETRGEADRAGVVAEVTLARMRLRPRESRELGKKALGQLDARADAFAVSQRDQHDAILVTSIPLARVVLGDAEAARRWRAATRAPAEDREEVALDAALSLEAIGDKEGAAVAYRALASPNVVSSVPFAMVVAHVRLAGLLRAAGRSAEVAPLEELVARLWRAPDPGLVDQVRALR